MFKKILAFFMAAVFCGLTYNAEAIVVDRRPVTVGISYLQQNDITNSMLDGAKKAAGKLKAKLIIRDGRGDTDVQRAQIHDLIAQQTGCLVIIYNNVTANGTAVENNNKSGIPTVVVDGKISDKKAAYDAAYKAVEEAWNKVKSKKVQPAFYSGY
ncbi:MAG: substrate-binding domain-containing protein [Phascolarctobacterium sp.]|nr:substrate-binding domain-containing protein [Candidatus Phascolarctobacterium equi]